MHEQREKITVDFYSEKDIDDYNRFILNRPDSTIYHTIEWKNVLEKNFRCSSFYLLSRDSEDKICAILPLFLVNNVYGKRLDSLPNSCYGGAVGDWDCVEPLLERAMELKNELKCKLLVIKQDPVKLGNFFGDFGMSCYRNWWRQIIEVKDPENMWNGIKKTNRTNIRKAKMNNLSVEMVKNEDGLKEFYQLELLNYKHLGFAPFSFEFFLYLWKQMRPKGYVEVFIARHDERAIASSLNFIFSNIVFSTYGGWDISKKCFKPNSFLDWNLLLWCYKKGYQYFDFGVTSIDNKGLFLYKSSFDTINTPYTSYFFPKDTHYFYNQNYLVKIGRRVLKKTPSCISKKLGMFLYKNFV